MGIRAKSRSNALQAGPLVGGDSSPGTDNQKPNELTLPSAALCIIVSTRDLPLRFVVDFRHQHNRQVTATGRGTLLSTGLQQSRGTASQKFCRRIVVGLLDVAHSDGAKLLVSFVVSTVRDPRKKVPVSMGFPSRTKKSAVPHFSRCRAIVFSIREVIVELYPPRRSTAMYRRLIQKAQARMVDEAGGRFAGSVSCKLVGTRKLN